MEQLFSRGFTGSTTKAGAAAGTTTTYTTANAVEYSIDGRAYKKAAVTNGATPTTDVNTGAAFVALQPNQGCMFVLGYNAAGAIKVAQGAAMALDGVAAGASASFAPHRPDFPSLPADFAPFATLETKVGASGSAWTFGASNLAGPPTNVLHTFVDVTTMPARP